MGWDNFCATGWLVGWLVGGLVGGFPIFQKLSGKKTKTLNLWFCSNAFVGRYMKIQWLLKNSGLYNTCLQKQFFSNRIFSSTCVNPQHTCRVPQEEWYTMLDFFQGFSGQQGWTGSGTLTLVSSSWAALPGLLLKIWWYSQVNKAMDQKLTHLEMEKSFQLPHVILMATVRYSSGIPHDPSEKNHVWSSWATLALLLLSVDTPHGRVETLIGGRSEVHRPFDVWREPFFLQVADNS